MARRRAVIFAASSSCAHRNAAAISLGEIAGLLHGLGLLVYGVLEMPDALERLVLGIAERQPVDVFLPDVAGADEAPVAALRERLIAAGARQRTAGEGRGEGGDDNALAQDEDCPTK